MRGMSRGGGALDDGLRLGAHPRALEAVRMMQPAPVLVVRLVLEHCPRDENEHEGDDEQEGFRQLLNQALST